MPLTKLSRGVKRQFKLRAGSFERSANWIASKKLLTLHKKLVPNNHNQALALELCCGTGLVGAAIKNKVKTVIGLDLSEQMLKKAKTRLDKTIKSSAENLPFPDESFDLVICRQSLHFLDIRKLAQEIQRVLKPNGQIIISQTVPFNKKDHAYLRKIHVVKQPLLKNFITEDDVIRLVKSIGCSRIKKENVYIKESITDWMKHAPELPLTTRQKVLELYHQTPAGYRKLHRLKITRGKITEYWKWVVVSGIKIIPLTG